MSPAPPPETTREPTVSSSAPDPLRPLEHRGGTVPAAASQNYGFLGEPSPAPETNGEISP